MTTLDYLSIDDPAVEALAANGWADDYLSINNLAHITEIVRDADRQAALVIRTEYAATTIMTNGKRDRAETGTDRRQAEAWVRASRRAANTMRPDTLAALGVTGHAVEYREVRQLPDGYELIGPWREATTEAGQ
ncbi:hypothetical protein [Micromonospora sp. WMMD737]|uniref:hypothetical protein n=1 Tax=Micromonospora sp. WMMD737 TaxID=3404113 RepID=UPI003B9321AF